MNSSISFTLSMDDIYTLTKIKFSEKDRFVLKDVDGNVISEKIDKNFLKVKKFFENFLKK